jgi:hypothetical protein
MTFEDYVYSLNGVGINGVSGGSFIDEVEVSWTMTKYTVGSVTNRMWHTYHQDPVHFSHTYITTSDKGAGVRPVIYLNSNVKIENNEESNYGTIYNPYKIVGGQVVSANNNLSGAAIGSYLYLNESNNPYTTTNEIVTSRLSYTYDKTKVRYRVVGINGDGSVKVERAALLMGLQSPVAINEDLYMAYYYKAGTCDYDAGVSTDCINHNYFKPNEGTGSYAYSDSENLAYFLNNATNSFYSWFSAGVKENIVLANWNLPTMANGVDYATVLFNTTLTGTYPTRSNDGLVSAYIGLPQWGSMFSGNDLNESYWYINRISNSNYNVGYQSGGGYTSNNFAADTWRAVRPVLNLKSNVKVVSGEGTPASPYVLNIQ